MRTIERDIVAAMIVSKDNKLFQGKKNPKDGGVYSDCWHIPGGGVRDNESVEEALDREIIEETGIDISNYKVELVDDEGRGESQKVLKDTGEKVLCKMKFIVYEINIDDKNADDIEVRLDDDLEKYQWVEFKDLKKIKLTPPSVELFTKLGYI